MNHIITYEYDSFICGRWIKSQTCCLAGYPRDPVSWDPTPYEWVMSHVGTHKNESCHTYEWVTSHVRMSHVTRANESCHTYEWVTSHVRMSHVTRTNESYPHKVMRRLPPRTCISRSPRTCISRSNLYMNHAHVWIGHVTHMNVCHATRIKESCHT